MHLYLDSTKVATMDWTQSGTYTNSIDKVEIGRHYYENSTRGLFNGVIDDVKIYNCPLDASEVVRLFNESTITMNSSLSIDEDLISATPNPSTNQINIENLTTGKLFIQLFNYDGVLIKQFNMLESTSVDISELAASMFFVTAQNDSHFKQYKLLIIAN